MSMSVCFWTLLSPVHRFANITLVFVVIVVVRLFFETVSCITQDNLELGMHLKMNF